MIRPNRRRFPAGKVNPISVLVIAALIGGGWYGFIVVPLYFDNLDVREAFDQALNVTVLEGVDRGRASAMNRINGQIGWHYQIDEETGKELVAPGLGVDPESLEIEVDTQAKEMTGHFEYTRVVQLKPFEKRKSYHYVHDKKVKLQ